MSMKMELEVDDFIKSLGRYNAKVSKALRMGVNATAESIILTAKLKYVPVDTGALKNSGTVVYTRQKGTVIESKYGFGGAAAPYAKIVHDRVMSSKNKPIYHEVGQAKYLEAAINEWKPRIISSIIKFAKGQMS